MDRKERDFMLDSLINDFKCNPTLFACLSDEDLEEQYYMHTEENIVNDYMEVN